MSEEKIKETKYSIRKSHFMSFRKCPQQGVFNIERGDSGYGELNTENEALLKGQIFHHSMEDFYNVLDINKVSIAATNGDLYDYFRMLFPKTTHPDLVQWFDWYAKNETERYFAMKKEDMLEYFMPFKEEYYVEAVINGLKRTGHVDRIDKIGPKTLVIVEYKTGFSYDPKKAYKLTDLNAELEWYRSIIVEMKEFKDYKVVGWRMFNPTVGVDFFKEYKPVTKYAVDKATEGIVEILDGKKPVIKKFGFICQWCPFAEKCLGYDIKDHRIFGMTSKEIKQKNEKEMIQ